MQIFQGILTLLMIIIKFLVFLLLSPLIIIYLLTRKLIIRFGQPIPTEVKNKLNSEQLNRLLKAVYELSSVQTIEDIKKLIIQYPILFSVEANKMLNAKIEQLKDKGKSTQTLRSNQKILRKLRQLQNNYR
ncbi:hypothetical protein QUF50_06635 [Thiotrichales bacterium HSG1]|nr:hypothetical protein [Thiotrichales bacterium HSG1]